MVLPNIRHVALVACRGQENLALSIEFERPLEPKEQGLFLGELGNFALEGCEVYEPRFSPDTGVVHLHPAEGQGQLEEDDYRDLLEHFGVQVTGNLPISTIRCSDEEGNAVIVGHPETGYVH